MQQTKRHHYVPKAYLKAFCDPQGKLRVYRKDCPAEPLYQVPDATQFRKYYYSQPIPEGGQDNNALEAVFSEIESHWPETVAKLHQRGDVNDRLENIFQFMALQRVRVPASRDAAEAMLAQTVKDTMKVMLANGKLPPPPPGLENLPDLVQVSIDPHQSIHSMVAMMQGMGQLFSMVGFAAVHNETERPFLTSDNPVLWFDPSLSFEEQRPYTIQPGGPVFLVFPVSPKLALVGSTHYKEVFRVHGLQHSDVPDTEMVDHINAMVCRFAYEAVISQSLGQEDVIAAFAGVSPVHEAVPIPLAKGMVTIHRYAFGPRAAKPKWRDR
ncbi:DUF4238 domain-containing protein [Variovorax sp. R-27]|uniref:DUF4238 domain-containing protein n=1 Tax=Variovorax sp. R-27 TaxID=3404058 RepID=UPI003CFAC471